MNHIRASAMGLAMKCNQSFRREPGEVLVNIGSEDASLGTAFHAVMAEAVRMRAETVGELDREILDAAATEDVSAEELRELVEKGIDAMQRIRGTFFPPGQTEHAEQSLMATAVPGLRMTGHIDWHAIDFHKRHAVMVDWKTGHLTDADHKPQMTAYALLLASIYNLSSIMAIVVTMRDGNYIEHPFDPADLRDAEVNLQVLADAPPTYSPGPHCSRCPRQAACPGRREYGALAVSAITKGTIAAQVSDLHPVQVTNLYDMLCDVERRCEEVRAAIRERVQRDGAVAGDAATLTMRTVNRRRLDPSLAWPVIERALGGVTPDLVDIRLGEVVSRVRAAAPDREKAKAEKQLYADLADAGAVQVTPTYVIKREENNRE